MRFLSHLKPWLAKHIRRGENLGSKILSVAFAVGGVVFFFTGDHVGMVICLVGFCYEDHQRQIAAVRREIRSKRNWDEGQ